MPEFDLGPMIDPRAPDSVAPRPISPESIGGRGGFSNIRQLPPSSMGALPVDEFMPKLRQLPQARRKGTMGRKLDRMFGSRRKQAPGRPIFSDVMPERMPSRFPSGGLGSILERIFSQLEREDESPRLLTAEDMPKERFPMMRPDFAEGDEVNMNMMMADQAARQGISPAEQRMMMIQKTAADMGRNISDRDAQLFGMGEISFEEAMSRSVAGPGVEETMGQFSDELRRIGKTEKGFSDFSDAVVNAVKLGTMDRETAERFLLGNTELFLDASRNKELQPFQGLNMSNSPRTRQGLRDSVIQSRNELQQQQLGFAAGDEVSSNVLGEFSEELPLTNYIMSLSNPEQSELLRSLIGVSGVAVGSIESIPMLIKRLVSTGSLKSPAAQAVIKESMDMQERKKMAEGGDVSRGTNEIDSALEDIQSVQPDAMVIQQVMTMVMEMIQSGASEEQIVAALKEMGMDDEDIQQVMMMIAEQMQGQDSIDGQLAQMM